MKQQLLFFKYWGGFVFLLLTHLLLSGQKVWEKTLFYKGYAFSADAGTVNKKGELFITGNVEGSSSYDNLRSSDELYEKPPAFLGDLSPLDHYMFVYKTDKNGDSLWLKLYPFAPSGTAITATSDGGFVCAGFTTNLYIIDTSNYRYVRDTRLTESYPPDYNQHSVILKCNGQGDMEWYKVIPTEYDSNTDNIVAVSDGYWFTAHIENPGKNQLERQNSRSIRLTKLNHKGDIIIDKILAADYPYKGLWDGALIADTADNLILAGTARGGYGKENSAFLFYLDQSGNKSWERYIGQTEEDFAATSLNITDERGFVLGAARDKEAYLYHLTSDGKVLWQKSFPKFSTWYIGDVKTAYAAQKGFFTGFSEKDSENIQILRFDNSHSFMQKTNLATKGKLIEMLPWEDTMLYIVNAHEIPNSFPIKIIKMKNK